jgi:hypothetical protein
MQEAAAMPLLLPKAAFPNSTREGAAAEYSLKKFEIIDFPSSL